MNRVTIQQLPAMFTAVAELMAEQETYLCAMDSQTGDGDLGITMKKGFTALPALLGELEEKDIGMCLVKAGEKMGAIVPSGMGTLMSAGVIGGGKKLLGYNCMDGKAYAEYLQGFAEAIAICGNCKLGDCTVLDAIALAAEWAIETALAGENNLSVVGHAAVLGARSGVSATKYMVPKHGKPARVPDRAAGIEDQGACAGLYMVMGHQRYFCRMELRKTVIGKGENHAKNPE